MKPRTTLLLLIVVAGLFAFIKFYNWPTTKELEERKNRVLKIDRDKIDGVTITNNEAKIELRKRGGSWFVDAPVKDRADSAAIEQLLGSVEFLNSEQTIPADEKGAKDRLKDFGLVTPSVRVQLLGKNAPAEILFGKDAAVEGRVYARLGEAETIYIIGSELKNQATKNADEFRDHKLTDLNTTQVSKVEIKTPEGEIELAKKYDHWQIEKPLTARGDDQKISDLIAQAANAHIEKFVSENEAKAAVTGLTEPRGTVTLFAEGKDKPAVLQIGQPPDADKERLYAKLSTRDGVYVLPKSVADILNTKPNDIRDKHLLRLNMDTVDRINIEPDGKEKITLARKEENWTIKSSGDRLANGAEVRRLAGDLQGAEVVAFIADTASDLPKYGLDKPSVKVTFSAYASENTAETKAGEKPIVSVLFGKVQGDVVYAKLDEEPFVVSLNKLLLDAIATDPVRWRDLAVFEFKPEEIESVEVTKADRPPVAIARENGQWKLAKGEGELNKINADSLVNTLSSLRAVRWIGTTTSEHGLEKPSVAIVFTTGDKKHHTLAIGAKTPEGMWFAAAENEPATFVVNEPDESALQIQLTRIALPEPPPKPSATKPLSVETK